MNYTIVFGMEKYPAGSFKTREEAEKAVVEFEKFDKQNDIFTPDFYKILEAKQDEKV